MKKISFLLALLLCFTWVFTPSLLQAKEAEEMNVAAIHRKKNKRPVFAVIGDPHIGSTENNQKVSRALEVLLKEQPHLDAIIVVGDITESGTAEEYQQTQKLFAHLPASVDTYFVMGNRDRMTDIAPPNGKTNFENILNQKINQYIEIKGYPFIFLNVSSSQEPYYSDVDQDFLIRSLTHATKRQNKKPIFVFAHVPAHNTVYGSGLDEGWGSPQLFDILKDFPQAVVFSAHSHYPISDERSIYQKYFTGINVGATSFTILEEGYSQEETPYKNYAADAIIATVKRNHDVILKRIDAIKGGKIKYDWVLKAPHNMRSFTYNKNRDNRSPEFAVDDKIKISNIEDYQCDIEFPQATDNDMVHHYVVDIITGKDDYVYQRYTMLSLFHLHQAMPQTLHWKAEGLKDDTTYKVRIIAMDSSGNASQPLSSDYFKTPKYLPSQDVQSPKANLLDIGFNDYTALDFSKQWNNITYNGKDPNTEFSTLLNYYVAHFNGDPNIFYKVPYPPTTQLEDVLHKGFTIELFYKTDEINDAMPVGMLSNTGFGIEQNVFGNVKFAVATDKKTYKVGDFTGARGKYNHYVFTFDGKEMRSYTNAIPTGITQVNEKLQLPSNRKLQWLGIGGNATESNAVKAPLSGSIAFLRIYGHSICRDEAYHLYELTRKRMNLQNMAEFNQLLTFAMPRRIEESSKKERKERLTRLVNKGWSLMNRQDLTQKEIDDFILEVKLAF